MDQDLCAEGLMATALRGTGCKISSEVFRDHQRSLEVVKVYFLIPKDRVVPVSVWLLFGSSTVPAVPGFGSDGSIGTKISLSFSIV